LPRHLAVHSVRTGQKVPRPNCGRGARLNDRCSRCCVPQLAAARPQLLRSGGFAAKKRWETSTSRGIDTVRRGCRIAKARRRAERRVRGNRRRAKIADGHFGLTIVVLGSVSPKFRSRRNVGDLSSLDLKLSCFEHCGNLRDWERRTWMSTLTFKGPIPRRLSPRRGSARSKSIDGNFGSGFAISQIISICLVEDATGLVPRNDFCVPRWDF
jgi:hypothetical protein